MAFPEFGQQGAASPSDMAGEYNETLFIVRQILSKVNVCMLVQVKAVHGGDTAAVGYVDVQPMVNQLDGLNRTVPRGKMFNLPFYRMQGGAGSIILDPQIGDIGLAIFSDRDISAVKRTKAQANPGSRRRFDAADGLYLGGFLNGAPTNYLKIAADGSITLKNASAQLTLLPDGSVNPKSWAGLIAPFAMGTPPPGWLACPAALTLVSTTTYANLFAAIGYTWGGTGGSFGLPFFAAGYVPIAGTPAALTHGALLAHTHQMNMDGGVFFPGSSPTASATAVSVTPSAFTLSTGGPDNLAAGMGVQWCVKY